MTTNFSEIADATRSFLDTEDKFTIPGMGEALTTANAEVQATYADYEKEIARLERGTGAGATDEDIGVALSTLKYIFNPGNGYGILVRADGPITVSYAQVGEDVLTYSQLAVTDEGAIYLEDKWNYRQDGPSDSWTFITTTLDVVPGYYILQFGYDTTQVLNTSATVLGIYLLGAQIRPEFIEGQPVQYLILSDSYNTVYGGSFYASKPESFTLDLGNIPIVKVREDYGQY